MEGRIEESEPDKDGSVTAVECRTDLDSETKKWLHITRNVKRCVRRVHLSEDSSDSSEAYERLAWPLFGAAALNNDGMTTRAVQALQFERTAGE